MKKRNLLTILSLGFLTVACTSENTPKTYTAAEVDSISAGANAFFDEYFDAKIDRSPMYQSYLGIKKDYGKWDDISDNQAKEEIDYASKALRYAKDSIDTAGLDKQTLISYQLFTEDLQNQIDDFKWRFHDYPINQMFGMHSEVPSFLINIHQVADSNDAAAYISRLQGVDELFDQLIINLKIREEKGIMPPQFVFPRVIEDSQNILKGAPFDGEAPGTILADFQQKVEGLELSEASKKQLIDRAKVALAEEVKPAYEGLIVFLKSQAERATTDDGAWKFPEGDVFYNVALKRTTTTDLTAEEIHEIGLKEVARIHGEMEEIMKQVAFEGDLQDFFEFLRTDDQFYFPDTEVGKQAYLDSAAEIIDRMKGELDKIFITKPKADIVVKRVEPFRENSAGKAFYSSPAPDGSRPGTFYANLASTRNMPKFEMEALCYHEGIPGHHMDRTIAQELTDIPKFRKYGGYTAYVEGWGLYTEFLPKEMGFYKNPYSDYGRLAMELWRACRLVVDTGIHSKKWTREQGIAYYQENTSGSERECVRMVERHIVMPSQATAYKIGMMKILDLRAKAKEQLGGQFDLREFHEVVLTSGAVPLNVLESLVEDWIASKKA